MENAPLTVDDDSETEYIAKKKDTKKFGFMAMESQTKSEDDKEKSFFSRLAEQEAVKKAEKQAKKVAEEEKTLEPEVKHTVPESEPVTEIEAPLEKPSKTETAEVIQPKLVEVIEEIEADKTPDPITDPPVNKFRELVKTGEDPEAALIEVLTELGAEDEIEETPEEVSAETEPEITESSIQDFEEDDVLVDLSDETMPEPQPEKATLSQVESTPEYTQEDETDTPKTPPSSVPPAPPRPPVGLPSNGPSPANRPNLPTVKKKLEQEVEKLQFQLQEKEKKIRRVAAEKVQQVGPAVIEVFKVVPAIAEKDSPEDRQKAPEAQLLHSSKKAHEHIGKVIVTAESKPDEIASKKINPEQVLPIISEQKIQTLTHAEILEMSAKIHVGDTTLRKIFETNLIGEKGLRRLISVYMRGGDLQKAIQNEIVEHEIDFERDPAMRDIAATSAPIQSNSGTALNNLLKEASDKVSGVDPEHAHYRQPKTSELSEKPIISPPNKLLLDYIFITIIIILIIAVIYLAFFR